MTLVNRVASFLAKKETHVNACCKKHGCRFGMEDSCPVFNQEVSQAKACKRCISVAEKKKKKDNGSNDHCIGV